MGAKRNRDRARRCAEEMADREPNERGFLIETLTAQEVGDVGEALAASYLRERGYEIVECNYRCPEGEVDLVAYDFDQEQVVLVEVKTRRSRSAEGAPYPEEAVGRRKRQRYRRIAHCYAMQHFPVPALRFDVIAVTMVAGGDVGLEHIVGAFDWEAGQ